jgi:S-adenosylmethionine/arginine decarboxylase-like enzyme
MASHHFLGTGLISEALAAAADRPEDLLDEIERRVADSGLAVVARRAVPFPGGGLTLVWVLAESHLVLHYWAEEGYATIDLHVCDYRISNADNARRLVDSLRRFCFAAGSDRWQEHRLDRPPGLPAPAVERPSAAAPRLQSTDN